MNSPKIYCRAVASAISQLDKFSFRGPEAGPDETDWDGARKLLVSILNRNGFELTTNQIRRKTK
jgi:hypothetical protein